MKEQIEKLIEELKKKGEFKQFILIETVISELENILKDA